MLGAGVVSCLVSSIFRSNPSLFRGLGLPGHWIHCLAGIKGAAAGTSAAVLLEGWWFTIPWDDVLLKGSSPKFYFSSFPCPLKPRRCICPVNFAFFFQDVQQFLFLFRCVAVCSHFPFPQGLFPYYRGSAVLVPLNSASPFLNFCCSDLLCFCALCSLSHSFFSAS